MKNHSRRGALLAGASLMAVGMAPAAFAQPAPWPAKPVTLVVPYAAGGNADAVARILSIDLSQRLGQQVLVDNRPGANGNVGTSIVARAQPDGHTLLVVPQNPIINSKLLYKSLPYDPDRDLMPVMKLVESPFAILAYPAKYPSVQALITYAKAHPGEVNLGTTGNGSTGHLLALLIEAQTGAKFNYVQYKGSGQMVGEIMTGRLDLTVDYPSSYVGQIESKAIRVLATLGDARSPYLPDIPTMKESGFAGVQGSGWFCLMGPHGMPDALVARINKAFTEALATPAVAQRLTTLGYTTVPGSPADLRALIVAETARLTSVVKNANIVLE